MTVEGMCRKWSLANFIQPELYEYQIHQSPITNTKTQVQNTPTWMPNSGIQIQMITGKCYPQLVFQNKKITTLKYKINKTVWGMCLKWSPANFIRPKLHARVSTSISTLSALGLACSFFINYYESCLLPNMSTTSSNFIYLLICETKRLKWL